MTNRVELKEEMLESTVGGTFEEIMLDMQFIKDNNLTAVSHSQKYDYLCGYGRFGVEVDYSNDSPNVYKIDGKTVTRDDALNYIQTQLDNKQ